MVLSSGNLANQFNMLVEEDQSITRETARKWLNGIALPEISRLKVLLKWLEIDANGFLNEALIESADIRAARDLETHFLYITKLIKGLDPLSIEKVQYSAWLELRSSKLFFHSFDQYLLCIKKYIGTPQQ